MKWTQKAVWTYSESFDRSPDPGPMIEYSNQRNLYPTNPKKKKTIKLLNLLRIRGGEEYSWEFLVGLCHPVLQILTLIQTKKIVIFCTSFQTRPLKSIPVVRPGLKAEVMLLYLD